GLGRGCVEENANVLKSRHAVQLVDTAGERGNAHAVCSRQAVGSGINPDHRAHFENAGGPQHLDHEVRADVAGTKDRYFGVHTVSVYLRRTTLGAKAIW